MAEAEHQTGCHDYSKSSKIWEGQELKQALNDLFFVPAFVRQLTVSSNCSTYSSCIVNIQRHLYYVLFKT